MNSTIRRLFGGDWLAALVPLVAITVAFVLALIVGAFVLAALGADPAQAYGAMLDGAFGTSTNFLRVLTRGTPLLLVAIGVCIAFRGGVVNIGVEGQLFVGAVSATAFALAFGASLPAWLAPLATLAAGALAGAAWGFVPGILKARFDVNEILSTVMMNEIAVQLLIFLLSGPMIDPEQVAQGTRVPQSARLPQVTWLAELDARSQLHVGVIVAVFMAVVVWVLLWRTTIGYRIRAVGLNKDAARYAGIGVQRYLALALTLSGALAGLAGAVHVTGAEHRMVEGFAVGYGFSGIVVALFGRLHPLGAVPAAFLFGVLLVGADKMQRTVQVPTATVIVLQGLVVIFVVSSDIFVRRWLSRRQARLAQPSVSAVVTPEVQA
ncbi:MAG: ABC transporter permease [Chloroflexi bacterium]|nr:ABC transporter permease [Chloroflexota bacterium]